MSPERRKDIAYKVFHYFWNVANLAMTKSQLKEWMQPQGLKTLSSRLNISEIELRSFFADMEIEPNYP